MDFVVLSHLRWDFVFQRPQHLLTRCAQKNRVFFWEEPTFNSDKPQLRVTEVENGVIRIIPELPAGTSASRKFEVEETLLREFLVDRGIEDFVLWFYTP